MLILSLRLRECLGDFPAMSAQLLKPAAAVASGTSSRIGCRCHGNLVGTRVLPQNPLRQQLSVQPAAAGPAWAPQPQQRAQRQFSRVVMRAEPEAQEESKVVYNTEFGYSRKDVLIIIVALIGLGVVMYEGLQAMGMDAGLAGNWVQLTIFMGICVGWVSTYLYRVANKKMTYARQLEMYESAVMQKRLEEMTEAELQQLMSEVEQDKAKLMAQKEVMQRQRQQQSSTPQ